jgi:ATP-dependent exoDNAse (exonuclease V) beta subunit
LNTNYEIYNASAGSGKTFTITSHYLSKLLSGAENDSYKKILALTFTNKASQEMKNRILFSLKEFSSPKPFEPPSQMLISVKDQLGIPINEIRYRSKKRLNLLLHNYSFFNVSTLDSFSHNIIRSFSRELKLSHNFRLILEPEELIKESIDTLLSLVGEQKDLTKVLVDFANEKIIEGKSWDITYDLKELSSLLNNENHYEKIKKLEDRTIKEYLFVKDKIFQNVKCLEKQISAKSLFLQDLIRQKNSRIIFSRNSFPNFLEKLKRKNFDKINIESIKKLFLGDNIITKKSSKGNEMEVYEFSQKLYKKFIEIEQNLEKRKVLKAFLRSILPVSVLSQLKKIYTKTQNEKGELLVSEFNKIISEEIKDQPTPYIFEKLGTRYKHYLVDEFQDTSLLQWSNLVPLISHSIESLENENDAGSLMIVGDPKQSLYRWRGANPDKFLSLLSKENPFTVNNTNRVLPRNYRSSEEIIHFNNTFFEHVSNSMVFKQNKKIYSESCKQDTNSLKGGYVSLSFLEKQKSRKENEDAFLLETLKIIKDCKKRGFSYSDQVILVRNKSQQTLISKFLIENEIPIISADALLIKNSKKVSLLVELIRLRNNPGNLNSKKIVLKFFASKGINEDSFCFYQRLINQKIDVFFECLLNTSFYDFIKKPVYEAVIWLQSVLGFASIQDAHLQFFMDELFEFFRDENKTEKQFLEFWDINKDKLNIPLTGNHNATQILTIHKSKGLEFPVVIYAFADSLSHQPNSQKIWLSVKKEKINLELLVPFNKTIKTHGKEGEDLFNKISKEEELDNINILYVALTRAINEMYIISSAPKKGSLLSHNDTFRSFLESKGLWDNKKLSYSWGNKSRASWTKGTKKETKFKLKINFYGNFDAPKLSRFYEDDQILFGDLFHKFMSKINYSFQYKKEVRKFIENSHSNKILIKRIVDIAKKTLETQSLSEYFTKEYEVICEKEIFTENKEILIPDRVVVSKNNLYTIIEYKTGEKSNKHLIQIKKYFEALSGMGLNVGKCLLVYVTPSIEVIEV